MWHEADGMKPSKNAVVRQAGRRIYTSTAVRNFFSWKISAVSLCVWQYGRAECFEMYSKNKKIDFVLELPVFAVPLQCPYSALTVPLQCPL